MSKRGAIIVMAIFFTLFAMAAWADEAKDHVCFRSLDADKNGLVTFEEFAEHYGADEARFKAADADQDGRLTHDEYHHLLGHGA